ncbi:right-handed parallel beta-helix repeat-containing protein [Paenibacillus oryzisoli]|uniref:right-handed parallel beta-helix repeat-containing protein n=1 Tax=Paenibacillus oryzisoli TaxID=1850517 RepID=UPI003D281DC8
MLTIRFKKFTQSFAIAFILAVLLFFTLQPAGIVHAASTTYYVDSVNGSDNNSGMSPSLAWKSLSKVNSKTFNPGDKILFHAGEMWTGMLHPLGSGVSGSPIVIDMYGDASGGKPLIQANGLTNDAVLLQNQQYWEINNLEVTNTATTVGDFRGIHVYGVDYGGTLNHIRINNVYVHDVRGEVLWVSSNGWDAAKNTGGIVINAGTNNPTNPIKSIFNDIVVENSRIENNSFSGITTKQYFGDKSGATLVNWGKRSSATDTNWSPFTNITIQNNYIDNSNYSFGSNGMLLEDVQYGTVSNNVINHVGTCGIELGQSDSVVVEKNDVRDTVKSSSGGVDFNAIDPDLATTNITVQYNYMHNNGEGVLLCQTCFNGFGGTAVVRYNIFENQTSSDIHLASGAGVNVQIYNNTFYNNKGTYFVSGNTGGTYTFKNNIFDSTVSGANLATGGGVTYSYNSYNNVSVPATDTHAVVGDPKFVNPGTGGTATATSGPALYSLGGYQLQSTSPVSNAGASISGNGGVDFWANPLYNGLPAIGANEYYSDTTSPTSPTNLTVTAVSNNENDLNWTASTDNMFVFAYLIYRNGTQVGTTLGLTSYKDTGLTASTSYSYTVYAKDSRGNISPVSNTSTALTQATSETQAPTVPTNLAATAVSNKQINLSWTAATDNAGVAKYLIKRNGTQVGITDGSTTSFMDKGLLASTSYNYAVYAKDAAGNISSVSNTAAATTLSAPTIATYAINSNFDNDTVGAAPSGWTISNASTSNSVTVVANPNSTNHSAQINKPNTSGLTGMYQTFTPLSGPVIVKYRVMRGDTSTFFSLPYIYDSAGNKAISVAFNNGSIQAYEGATMVTLRPFTANTWYDIEVVLDTATDIFDLYINGIQVVSEAPMRTAVSSVNKIQFYADSSNSGTAYIDYIQVGKPSAVAPTIATYTINNNFDSDTVGSAPSGWTIDNANTSNSVTVVANPSSTNHSAQINKPNTSGLTGMYRTFTPLSGQVIVKYRVMRGDISTYFSLPYIYDSIGNKPISVAFNAGNIQVFEGSTLTTIQPFTANTWYDIAVVLNTNTDTFDFYINGTQVVAGAALRTAVTNVSKIQFYADNVNAGTAFIDYVQVGQ